MNGSDLEEIIKKIDSIKAFFLGVFSINNLPTIIPLKHFLICNFDFDYEPGSHWFCLIRRSKLKIECFDSLGLTNEKIALLKKYCNVELVKYINFNKSSVQHYDTNSCGKFVIFFLVNRLLNYDLSFHAFLNAKFSSHTIINERRIKKFFFVLKNESSSP